MDQLAFALAFTGGIKSPETAEIGNVAVAASVADGLLTYQYSARDLLRQAEDYVVPEVSLPSGSVSAVTVLSMPIVDLTPAANNIRAMVIELSVYDQASDRTGLVTMAASFLRKTSTYRVTNRDQYLSGTTTVAWTCTLIEAMLSNIVYGTLTTNLTVSGANLELRASRITASTRTVTGGSVYLGKVRAGY
jgi:hypothetical protein